MTTVTLIFAVLLASLNSFATNIPTANEIKAAAPKIDELTRDDYAALKAKKIDNVKLGETLLGYISEGDEPAATFVLRQKALKQFVLGMNFDKADELYSVCRAEGGIEYALEVADSSRQKLNMLSTYKRPKVKAFKERIADDEKVINGIRAIKAKIKKDPASEALQEQLAVEYIACGDWESALACYSTISGEIAKVAEWELSEAKNTDYDSAKIAKFWWGYTDGYAKRKAVAESIKVHAANWYKKAVALNHLTGLDAKVAEKRIEESENFAAQDVVKEQNEKDLYMIVDLTKVGKKAVSYLDEAPKGGWGDEYKTKKIVFRKIFPGSFEYMPGKKFKLTKPYYIGVFEVTQKQYEMIAKVNPSEFKGDMRPVEMVSYLDIRGSNKGLNRPKDDEVDNDSFLGKLRKRIGLRFDLPTEVQWEYACRAGTTGNFNVEGVEPVKLMKCKDNGGQNDHHVTVGSFIPNAWGLYDMHGNVWEWCVDRGPDGAGWMDWSADAKEIDTDPKGPAVGSSRIRRGGSWGNEAHYCRSSQRYRHDAGGRWNDVGFRLSCSAVTAK